MATTPGKMTGTEENTTSPDTMSTEAGRSWSKGASGNVSNISEGKGTPSEGWTEQVQEGASELADRAQGIASNVASRAQELASNVASKTRDFASTAADKTTNAIREYPLQSLIVGFGIGCLVGFLIPRR